jgi:DNA polymerase-1
MEQANDAWDGLAAADVVAVDCETSGLFPDDSARVSCVACAWKGGSLALPYDQGVRDKEEKQTDQLTFEDTEEGTNLDEDEWKTLLWMLAKKRLVFHNAGFDLIMLGAGTRHWSGVDLGCALHWDTESAHRILRPNSSAGLDNAARELGVGGKQGLDDVKAWLRSAKKPKRRYDLVPWHIIEPYVRGDAETTLALYEEQVRHFKEQEDREQQLKACRREFDLAVVLMRMEQRGIAYDAERSLQAAEEMEGKCADIVARLPFKMTPAGAKKYFLEQGPTVDRTTPKGAPSIDAEQIETWVEEGVEWAAEYRDATKTKRAVSMYYRGYVDKLGADGRLRCRYRQTKHYDNGGSGARSGRLSCERVNLMALPKADKIEEGIVGVRDLLLPKKGCSLISLDMQQAELRCAAKYSGCEKMLTMLNEGVDFHGKTTEDVMHVGRDHPEWKLKRDIGKKLTFMSVFGGGGERFQALLSKETGIHLELEECIQLVANWRQTYPEIMAAYRRAERAFRERGFMKILAGTEYEGRSYLADGDFPHTGWNRCVQGSLAAWLRLWLVEVDKEHPGSLVLTVHDSIVIEAPKKTALKTAKLIAAKSSARASELFKIPMPIDIEVWK